jgi:hypothetical protein
VTALAYDTDDTPSLATLAREAVDRIVARCAGCRRAIESACV